MMSWWWSGYCKQASFSLQSPWSSLMSDVSFKVSFGWSSRVWALTYLQNVPNNLWKQNHGDEKCEYSPSGFDHLLCHIVEEVPAAEGEGRLQEGERDLPNRRRPLQREGHLRRQRLVVSWWLHETSELLAFRKWESVRSVEGWQIYHWRSGPDQLRWWGPTPSASPPWRRPGSWWPCGRWSSSPRSAALSRAQNSLTTHSRGQRVLRTSLQYKGQTWHVSITDQRLSADSEGGGGVLLLQKALLRKWMLRICYFLSAQQNNLHTLMRLLNEPPISSNVSPNSILLGSGVNSCMLEVTALWSHVWAES